MRWVGYITDLMDTGLVNLEGMTGDLAGMWSAGSGNGHD